jgi:hypothetical protein
MMETLAEMILARAAKLRSLHPESCFSRRIQVIEDRDPSAHLDILTIRGNRGLTLARFLCKSIVITCGITMLEEGQSTPQPGLYRCATCGSELFVPADIPFPSCGATDHATRWLFQRIIHAAMKKEPRSHNTMAG